MRLFYSGDVHGSERCFRKFLNAAEFYEADALVLGGDITGKVMVPLVEEKPGRYVATVMGRKEKAKRPDDLADLEQLIRFNGFYPHRCSKEEYERLRADDEYRESVMSRVMLDEVRRWMAIADEKLAGSDVRCLVMPGNDDELVVDEALGSETVENPEGRVVDVDGFQVLSSAWANPTPWDSPREEADEELARRFDAIASGLDPDRPAIFNLHVPPYDTGLDTAAELDADLNVVTDGGQPRMVPVGSKAVRALIEIWQPVVALHGHIHESRGMATVGHTLCFNPGSNYADGVLDGVIVELEDRTVVRHQFVSG